MSTNDPHAPGMPIVTVIGDGQLARMMQTEATELGLTIRLLAGATDSSAAQVTPDITVGDYTQLADVQAVASGASAVTFDHEHVPNDILHTLIDSGINVQPVPDALIYAQDKLKMREKMQELGLPVPWFTNVTDPAALPSGKPICLKAIRGGYDGHGVWFTDDAPTLAAELMDKGVDLMAEDKVELKRELSILSARRPSGDIAQWAITETIQTDGICVEALAPAPGLTDEQEETIRHIGRTVAEKLGVTGVLAVELFETTDGEILINELAMRPHNTGHWTQDGSVTSQFEQHLRAVLDLPLGSTALTAPATCMVNTLGGDKEQDIPAAMRTVWETYPEAKIHWYGKSYRAGRKLGHVNVSGADATTVRARARAAAAIIVGKHE